MSPERTQRTSNLRVLFTPIPYFWLKGFGVNLFFLWCVIKCPPPPNPIPYRKELFLTLFWFLSQLRKNPWREHTRIHTCIKVLYSLYVHGAKLILVNRPSQGYIKRRNTYILYSYIVNTSYSIGLGLFLGIQALLFSPKGVHKHIPGKAYLNHPLKRRTVAALHMLLYNVFVCMS